MVELTDEFVESRFQGPAGDRECFDDQVGAMGDGIAPIGPSTAGSADSEDGRTAMW